ncbi:MAG: DEAD/DEAH box helicase, partial [Candidatus Gracilibacteria bacterium]|nr:DEAD/DEAH box helicase [Candidatus Gracilibacteria bacterium]
KYLGKTQKEDLLNLSLKTKPFILRRTKEEVLTELPPKQEEVVKLEMGEKQKDFYMKLKTAFKLQISKELKEHGLNKARFQVLDSLLKLRQACLVPELVNMENNTLQDSIKIQYIEENIEDMIISGHNLLIFSQFTGFLQYVKNTLDTKDIQYNYLDGKTKPQERKKLVDEFNNGKKNVFIISLKAGGTGLNLTKADYVLHLDPWWNPAVENQATDRAHRMGQKKTVFVKKLITKDTIEEKILQLQEKKKKLIDDLFSGNFSGSLSQEDIDFIFE